MKAKEIIDKLKEKANSENLERMKKFGINPKNTLGVFMPEIRKIAKDIGKNHELALNLWNSRIHEARILAGLIDEKEKITKEQMDKWAREFDSWDVCDYACMNLFHKTKWAFEKATEWTKKQEEFYKRAGFALIASLCIHDKKSPNSRFEDFFEDIRRECCDNRNYVKKSVNWALRQIGKRNLLLNKKAIKVAEEILKIENKTAKWIARDTLRELKSKAVKKRILDKSHSL